MKVFISYAREDLEIAKKLRDDLEKAGVKTWLDKEDLLVGQDWHEVIIRQIRESNYFLALISSTSVSKRGPVQTELNRALKILDDEFPPDQIFILPVRIDNCQPQHEKLKRLHWADLFPSYRKGLNDILKALGITPPPKPLLRIPRWLIAVVALLAIAGAMYPVIRSDALGKLMEAFRTAEVKTYSLTIRTEPSDAVVRFENSKTEYQSGMKLKPGTYQIIISREGFKSKSEKVEIKNDNVELPVTLEEIRYSLTINPDPSDADVKIVNPQVKYQPEISLKPGSYQIEVSRDGFRTKKDRIEIRNQDVVRSVALDEIKYALTVKSDPSDAVVRIMNISEPYKPGMLLKPGSYDIQVSKAGYKSFRENKEITDSALILPISLEKTPEPPPKPKYDLRSKPITTDNSSDFKSVNVKNEFVDNGDGTITDHATGLMWQKSGSPDYLYLKDVPAYIEKINREKFAGYSDWRLPTVDELKSLLTQKEMNGDLYIDPIFDKTQRWCWTSDKRASGGAWYVNFSSGYVGWGYDDFYCVRAVRLRQ